MAFQTACENQADFSLELIHRLNAQLGKIMSDRGDATEGNPIVVGIARLLLFALFKADYVYFSEMPNWFLKAESAINYLNLSQLVFGYQKFESYRVWYREILSDYIADILRWSLMRSLDKALLPIDG